jgi:hypothetical protein
MYAVGQSQAKPKLFGAEATEERTERSFAVLGAAGAVATEGARALFAGWHHREKA